MKKIIYIIAWLLFLLLLIPSVCLAGLQEKQCAVIAKKNATSCSYTSKDTNATGANNMVVGSGSLNLQVGNSFTSGSAYTLKKVALSLKKVGTGGYTTLTINVCANSDTVPGACTAVGTQTVADLTTDFVTHEYTYATGYAISNTTNYWIVLVANTVGDAENYVTAARNGVGSMAMAIHDGTVWNVNDATSDLVYTTYSCE